MVGVDNIVNAFNRFFADVSCNKITMTLNLLNSKVTDKIGKLASETITWGPMK